jgi:hypothetical protein
MQRYQSDAMQKIESAKSAKEIVMEFIEALERKDFKTVRSYISDNISVLAPGPVELTTFNQAESFTTYLEHANLPRLEIKKEFADSNDVCPSLRNELYRAACDNLCLWVVSCE